MARARLPLLLGTLLIAAAAACGSESPADRLRGTWVPAEEADAENPALVLTFEEGGVVTATGRDTSNVAEGEYTFDREGAVRMIFEQGAMEATLTETGDSLRVEFRGRSGTMVRIED